MLTKGLLSKLMIVGSTQIMALAVWMLTQSWIVGMLIIMVTAISMMLTGRILVVVCRISGTYCIGTISKLIGELLLLLTIVDTLRI